MCRLSVKDRQDSEKRALAPSLKIYLFFFQSLFPPLDKAHIAQHIWEAPDRNMSLKEGGGG